MSASHCLRSPREGNRLFVGLVGKGKEEEAHWFKVYISSRRHSSSVGGGC